MHWSVCTWCTVFIDIGCASDVINTEHQMHLLYTENETHYFCVITNTAWSIKISQYHRLLKVRKKATIRNQFSHVPHLTQDTEWESDKNTRKHHVQESQEVSPFPTGDHKAATNRHLAKTNTNNEKIHKRNTTLEWSVRKLFEGLN